MTFDEYQTAVLRTANMGRSPDLAMAVFALGLCGEVVELYEAVGPSERLKEAGDVLWYAAALASAFGISGKHLGRLCDLSEIEGFSSESLQSVAGKLAELVKKQVGHGKPASFERVCTLIGQIIERLPLYSEDLGAVAEANIAKLKARYPDGWDLKVAAAKPDSNEPSPNLKVAIASYEKSHPGETIPLTTEPPKYESQGTDDMGRTVEDTGFDPGKGRQGPW